MASEKYDLDFGEPSRWFSAWSVGDGQAFAVVLPAAFRPMVDILRGVLDDLGRLYEGLERRYDDASWVGYRFAEILPITPEQKQFCLETDDALQRLEIIRVILRSAGDDGDDED